MTDWKTRALEAEKEVKTLKGIPLYDSLSEELQDNLPEPDYPQSEGGFEGDPELRSSLEEYFKDKPERGYEFVAYSEEFNGRQAWPPFTEILLFKVDGQLFAADGQSDSWEGGWPHYAVDSIRAVEEVEETIPVKKYKTVEEK